MPKSHKSKGRAESSSTTRKKSSSRKLRKSIERRNSESTTTTTTTRTRCLRSTTSRREQVKDSLTSRTTTHSCKMCKKTFTSAESVSRHSRSCKSAIKKNLQEEEDEFSSSSSASIASSSDSEDDQVSGQESSEESSRPSTKRSGASKQGEILEKRPRGRPPKNKIEPNNKKTDATKDNKRKRTAQSPSSSSSKKNSSKKKKRKKTPTSTSSSSSGSESEESVEIIKEDSKSSTKSNKTKKKVSTKNSTGKINDSKPLTCEACKMTYRTESGFYNHISSCVPYSSSSSDGENSEKNKEDDEEEDDDDYSNRTPQRRPGYEETVVFSDDDDVGETSIEASHSDTSKSVKVESNELDTKYKSHGEEPLSKSTGTATDNEPEVVMKLSDVTGNATNSSVTNTKVLSSSNNNNYYFSIDNVIGSSGPPKQVNQFVASVERFFSNVPPNSSSSSTINHAMESSSTSIPQVITLSSSSPSSSSSARTKPMTSSSRHSSSNKAVSAKSTSTTTIKEGVSSNKMTSSVGSQSESHHHRIFSPKEQSYYLPSSISSSSSSIIQNTEASISHIHSTKDVVSMSQSLGYSQPNSLYPPVYPPSLNLNVDGGSSRCRPKNGQQHHHHQHSEEKEKKKKKQQHNVSTYPQRKGHHQEQSSNVNSHLVNHSSSSNSSSITNSGGGIVIGESNNLHSSSTAASQFSPTSNQLIGQQQPQQQHHPPPPPSLLYPPGFRSESAYASHLAYGGFNTAAVQQQQQANIIQSQITSNLPQVPLPLSSPKDDYEPETITMQDATGQIVRIQVPPMNQQLAIQPPPPPPPSLHPPILSPIEQLQQQQLVLAAQQQQQQQQQQQLVLAAQQQHLTNFAAWQQQGQQQHQQIHYSQQHDMEIQNLIFQQQQQQLMAAQIKQHQFLEAQLKQQHLQHELQQHSLHQYVIKHGSTTNQNLMINPTMDGTQWFSITNPNTPMIPQQLPGPFTGGVPHEAFIHSNALSSSSSSLSSSYVLLQNGPNFSSTPFSSNIPAAGIPSPRQQQQQQQLMAAAQHNTLLQHHHSPGFYGGGVSVGSDQISSNLRLQKNNNLYSSSSAQETLYTLGQQQQQLQQQQKCILSSSSSNLTPHDKIVSPKKNSSSSTSRINNVPAAQACPCTLCIKKASNSGIGSTTKTTKVAPVAFAKKEESGLKYVAKNKVQQQFSTPLWNAGAVVGGGQAKKNISTDCFVPPGKTNHNNKQNYRNRLAGGTTTTLKKILPATTPTQPLPPPPHLLSKDSTKIRSLSSSIDALNPIGALTNILDHQHNIPPSINNNLTTTPSIVSTANVAVVRPLENPLQKLSAQISQIGAQKPSLAIPLSYPESGGGGGVGTEKSCKDSQIGVLDKDHVKNKDKLSIEDLYKSSSSSSSSNISSISSGMSNEKIGSRNPSQNQPHQHHHREKPIKSKSGQTDKISRSELLPSSTHADPSPPVKRRRSSKAKASGGDGKSSKKELDDSQRKSIKVTLKRKEGNDSYSIRDIKEPLEAKGPMRSLKIKAKITSGEQAGNATDVVVIPVVHTVPIPYDSESNRTIAEGEEAELSESFNLVTETATTITTTPPPLEKMDTDKDKKGDENFGEEVKEEKKEQEHEELPADDDPESVVATKALQMTHRAVIVYEVKTGETILFRSSNVRAVWSYIFDNVQGQPVNCQNLPPLAYPQQLVSFIGKKPDLSASSSSFNTSEITHRAVQFLLQNLPGPGTSKPKFSKSKKKQLLESMIEDSPQSEPVNDPGCARVKGFTERKPFDMFGWLASKHRTLPTIERSVDVSKVDLPIAMRYRTVREKSTCLLGVFYSTIHGRGLFTRRDIPEGEIIIEYAGEVIRSVLCDFREKYYESKGYGCYMFKIDDEEVVDSTLRGNAARFINHSCDPNCKSKVVEILNKKRILIFSLRKILGGEELTYDYKFPREDRDKKIPCTCGTKRCRKFLN